MLTLLSSTVPSIAQKPNAKIAIVYSTGGLGDRSFNDAAFRGIEAAKNAHSGITVAQAEPKGITEITQNIETFAAAGTYDLVIGVGFTATDGINASATKHPSQKFMIIDSVVNLPNVDSVVFKEEQGSFLAGAMAAMTTKTNKIAFLGGLDIPLINKFLAGYAQGAKYINPNITVLKTYSPNPSIPWTDIQGGKTVGLNFLAQGVDIIYAAAGGTGVGVMDAVATKPKGTAYAIGVDSNQDYIKPGYVLTSMVKRVDVAVSNEINKIVDGTWKNGVTSLGLKENGVGITDMNYTKTVRDGLFANDLTRWNITQNIRQEIIDGKITVSATSTNTPATSFKVSFYNTTATATNPLPFNILGFVFAIALIPILKKYKKN